jgi:aminoglycoside phosphotransferase (APT) family kinase protein
MNKPLNLAEIISNFQISVDPDEVKVFGNGHINDTYLLKATDPDNPGYLLQKINHFIFKDVPGLTRNIWLVTNHLRNKIEALHDIDSEKKVLRLIPANDGSFYYNDAQGQYWRVYDYLAGTNSYDIVSTEKQAYEGGKAFGRFQSMLSDLDAGLLIATIPDFLNMTKRMEAFDRALSADVAGRVAEVQGQIQFVRQRAADMCYFQSRAALSILPLRVTHNDTKFNNVLLDKNDEAQCVIDLDTVMPGYVAYDFGDAIRSIINTAAEDEADLEQIKLNIPLFKAYTDGYFKEASQFLLPVEIASLMKGVLLLPFMQSVRFLTDYLEGDQYYKIHFEGHNLQRTNAQIQLVRQLEQHEAELSAIIEKAGQQMTGKTITNQN